VAEEKENKGLLAYFGLVAMSEASLAAVKVDQEKERKGLLVTAEMLAVSEALVAAWEQGQLTLTEALYEQALSAITRYYDALCHGQHDTLGRVHPFRTEYHQDLEARLVYAQMRWCETADKLQIALAAVEGLEGRVGELERERDELEEEAVGLWGAAYGKGE